MRRALLLTTIALVGALALPTAASAHRFPANCDGNQLDVDLIRDRNLVKFGDIINYMVEVDNEGTRACDVSNITVRVRFPAPDGTPNGPATTVTANQTYAAQTAKITSGPYAYVVDALAGISRLEARVSIENGVLHDNDVHSAVNINKTIGTIIPKPGIEVDKTADPKVGPAPQNTTYTFRVYNRTEPPATLDNVTVTDNHCPNVVGPVSGDDGDRRLQPAEVWVYTCTMQHGVGVFNNTVTACAELILNGGPMPKVCDTDDETVQYTAPPQGAVQPAAARQEPCTVKTPDNLRVRAGERNTIRVRTRNVDAGTLVRVTLPGGRVLRDRTDRNGLAVFRVTPPRSGTARIQAAQCADIERLSVRQARKTVSRQVPRVTG